MKKVNFFFVFFLGVQSFIWSNPVDGRAKMRFSELVFDESNHWTMELLYFTGYEPNFTDSVIITASNVRTKLLVSYRERNHLYVITQDSLSVPLFINSEGDKIEIKTYSNFGSFQEVWNDSLIFGNYPGATVGSHSAEFHSICRLYGEFNLNSWSIECLAKHSSLGVMNSLDSLGTTMQGHIYDMNNIPVSQSQIFSTIPCYLELETPLTINTPGVYTTRIFRKFPHELKNKLYVKSYDFEYFRLQTEIDSFELNDIHPDTVINQDIHLKTNEFIISSIKDTEPLQVDEFTLINYPNPFNLSTNIFVKIPERMGEKSGVINIYNSNGELIKAIPINKSSTITWDGKDNKGSVMPSGIYMYQLVYDQQMMKTGSMILLK